MVMFSFSFFHRNFPFLANLAPKFEIVSLSRNVVPRLIQMNMHNSVVVFTFFYFEHKYPFWGNLLQKINIDGLSLKFGAWTKLNMQNSMVMFTFSVLKWEYTFLANLVQKIKNVKLFLNLVPRLTGS